ncbi:tripartite tricarboxylate transporter TctB family protein [Telmatospirillum sp. J64-1]|uniref:tripartite tricarboxylate transporter TctB family protein n=1 Tax=Telmatospirillum sp. J64-1 TaxID=2502183 RepID=UPI00115D7982|nr:tripartite tricarboxylate transporter TctB family protein [Telmatospirillum sp. J64-1]
MALMRYGTILAALVMGIVAIVMIVVAGGFPAPSTLGAPGPARLPTIYATLLAVLAGALILRSLFGAPEPGLSLKGSGRAMALTAGTAVCVYLWSMLDFLVLFIPATLIGVRLLGAGWIGAFIAAALMPAAVYGLFHLLLDVPFP